MPVPVLRSLQSNTGKCGVPHVRGGMCPAAGSNAIAAGLPRRLLHMVCENALAFCAAPDVVAASGAAGLPKNYIPKSVDFRATAPSESLVTVATSFTSASVTPALAPKGISISEKGRKQKIRRQQQS